MGVAPAEQFAWSAAAVARLKQLWAAGCSASQIARALSDGSRGPSRSAVLGKAHRLDLGGHAPVRRQAAPKVSPSNLSREEQARRRRARALARALGWRHSEPRPAAPPRSEAPPAESRPCGLLELTGDTCRWPIGEPGTVGFCFCGAPPLHKQPYCAHHERVAHELESADALVEAARRAA
jgi:GcrA cell cycle regulator